MRRNYYWKRTPARIVQIKKEKDSFGILRIEAVLESLLTRDVEVLRTIVWVYAPAVKT